MSFVFVNLLTFSAFLFMFYFLSPPKFQWVILLTASLIFYALLDIRAIIYLILTICSIFFCAGFIQNRHTTQGVLFNGKDKEWLAENRKIYISRFDKQRKLALAAGLLFNFGILTVLKYSELFFEIINSFFYTPVLEFKWLLPVGISFYTFQSIGYLMDVYRKKYPAEANIAKLALFISFFPQVVQGPIGRYDHLAHQLFAAHRFDFNQLIYGLKLMGWGFAKKLLIADVLSPIVGNILQDQTAHGAVVAFGIVLSMLQLYADFSGGIDVSRGIAQCMGIEMAENFRRPYFATSVADYWRRWHITLGSWMKDYLLYSITFSKWFSRLQKFSRKNLGKRNGKIIPTCLAMFFVFFMVGVWHGANTKFLAFGFYYGILIALGIFTQPLTDRLCSKISGFMPENMPENKICHVLSIIKTLFLVFIGKYFSSADNFSHAISLLKATFTGFFTESGWLSLSQTIPYGLDIKTYIALILPVLVFFFISLLQENGVAIRNSFSKKPIVVRWFVYYAAIFYVLLFGSLTSVGGFMYAQF